MSRNSENRIVLDLVKRITLLESRIARLESEIRGAEWVPVRQMTSAGGCRWVPASAYPHYPRYDLMLEYWHVGYDSDSRDKSRDV
jgi:hypothetical protein